jgi:hypothetical protein
MGSKVDLEDAQRQLDAGRSIREVAISQGVSTQRLYQLIHSGRLKRPEQDSPESR